MTDREKYFFLVGIVISNVIALGAFFGAYAARSLP
jgi:hypothetical protein